MTAIEWLVEQYVNKSIITIEDIEQAKEMEKQQIGKAFLNGRLKEIGSGVLFDLQPLTETFHNYYNETFKSE
jgi:predicted transcriptional regulator of viral defense system